MSAAYIVDYVRTPIGRFRGRLAPVRTDDLAALPITELMGRHPSVEWERIDDVILGCTNQAGEDNRNVARMALLLAGMPDTVPGLTVNRLCGSGMNAVALAAQAIRLGEADMVVAGGVESMSRGPLIMPKAEAGFQRGAEIYDSTLGWRMVNPRMAELGHTDSLGMTAENVAEEFSVSRDDQDAFALRSQDRATAAIKSGRLAEEIVPVMVPRYRGEPDLVDTDEHPRPDTTREKLAALPPAFKEGGTVTAGNASGINDGAAALLLMSERAVEATGLKPMAKVAGAATAAVPPRIMGIGPVPATAKLLDRADLAIGDIDFIELNEAFASQALASLRAMGLSDDAEHVNPNGGAIALGHPTGMSGARITGTAAVELVNRDAQRALATMCIGVGQGIALLLDRA